MWLEQTVWIWAPLGGAALIWMTTRLVAIGREVRRLRMRIAQLEDSSSRSAEQATPTLPPPGQGEELEGRRLMRPADSRVPRSSKNHVNTTDRTRNAA